MKRICGLLLTLALVLGLGACAKKAPAWQEQYDLGVKYLSEGNYQEAIIAFTAAIEIDPKRPEAYLGRGDAYIGSGETEENLAAALADYEQAAALDETNPAAYLGIADVYIRMGEYDKALEILRAAMDKTGNNQSISDKITEMENGEFRNASGTLRRKMVYEDSILHSCTDYDVNGKAARREVYNLDGSINNYTIFENSEDGRTITESCYLPDGELWHKTIDSYREDGLLERSDLYETHLAGWCGYYELFEYDADGKRVKSVRFDLKNEEQRALNGGELRYYTFWEYNDNGKVKKITHNNADGTLDYYQVYEYDKDGNSIGYTRYDSDGTMNVYTYDKH